MTFSTIRFIDGKQSGNGLFFIAAGKGSVRSERYPADSFSVKKPTTKQPSATGVMRRKEQDEIKNKAADGLTAGERVFMSIHKFLSQIGKEGRECRVFRTDREDVPLACETGKDKDHFYDLTKHEKEVAKRWLQANLIGGNTILHGHTSYGMKHVLEKRTGIYMTNNQMKELMLACGFFPAEVDTLNWEFHVKKNSPMFKMFPDGLDGIPMLGDPVEYGETDGLKVFGDDSERRW